MLNGPYGDASYCLGGGGFYQTKLSSEGTATTPDGFLGSVYRENYPHQPFLFLFTKNTIGNTPYYRVYTRPADNPGLPFTWFCDATRRGVGPGLPRPLRAYGPTRSRSSENASSAAL